MTQAKTSVLALSMGALALLWHSPSPAQSVPAIETLMTAEESSASGLDSLSAEELEALNQWLRTHMTLADDSPLPALSETLPAVEEPVAAADDSNIQEEESQDVYGERDAITDLLATIKGEFTGWDGATVFRLSNGQIYQQRRPGRWKTSLQNPEVRITKRFIGYELEVADHSIGVKRLR